MMSRDFVDSVINGDNVHAQDTFKTAISDKVGETLEVKRREYANSFVNTLPQAVEDDD
jgi:hypothetical protein